MALFAIWHDDATPRDDPAAIHARLATEAHVVPERITSAALRTPAGTWHLAAFATASAFYPTEAQVWLATEEACVIHGLVWRMERGAARLLDARALAVLLPQPGATLPADVAGEYAVARLHRCGTLEAFGDPAGLHQIFHRDDGRAAVANRAGLLAALGRDWRPERRSALWLGAIGYRAGPESGWRGVRQLAQDSRLTGDRRGLRASAPPRVVPEARGFDSIDEGLEQAQGALRLAAGGGTLDLPLTGGKDSRAVLAVALSAGLRDRITLFTRGYEGHPDVVAAQAIAAALGLAHRREAPLGSDTPTDLSPAAFAAKLARLAYQTDGGMGGWDDVSGTAPGRENLVSGHMGELLKGYAKRPPGDGPVDPAALVRLQGPFDPMKLLRPRAHDALVTELAAQLDGFRAEGATADDLPDLFYWRNRIPNWLGGIRGVKAFERQPVLPLGVPALRALAFRMTAAERRAELAHYRLIEAAAPELLPFPFAHQRWSEALPGAPRTAPVVAAAGAPLFGNWQWSLNRDSAVRAHLSAIFAAVDIPLWDDVDRTRLLGDLRERRFDYFDAISLLGFAVAAFHQAGLTSPEKLGGKGSEGSGRPHAPLPSPPRPPAIVGHLDGALRTAEGVELNGWAHSPDWPGTGVAIQARASGRATVAAANRARPDLAAAGIGDGRHGFTFAIDVPAGTRIEVGGPGGDVLADGVVDAAP